MNEIVVEKPEHPDSGVYRAYFADDEYAEAFGYSPMEAVGFLVNANQRTFRCAIEFESSVPEEEQLAIIAVE